MNIIFTQYEIIILYLFSGKVVGAGQGLFCEDKIVNIKEADFCSKNLEDLEFFLKNIR